MDPNPMTSTRWLHDRRYRHRPDRHRLERERHLPRGPARARPRRAWKNVLRVISAARRPASRRRRSPRRSNWSSVMPRAKTVDFSGVRGRSRRRRPVPPCDLRGSAQAGLRRDDHLWRTGGRRRTPRHGARDRRGARPQPGPAHRALPPHPRRRRQDRRLLGARRLLDQGEAAGAGGRAGRTAAPRPAGFRLLTARSAPDTWQAERRQVAQRRTRCRNLRRCRRACIPEPGTIWCRPSGCR